MNHKEKQEEIEHFLKFYKKREQERQLGVWFERAKAHKKEVEKGCGKRFYVRRYRTGHIMKKSDVEYKTTKKEIIVCGNNFSKKNCKSCQEVLDKYLELDI